MLRKPDLSTGPMGHLSPYKGLFFLPVRIWKLVLLSKEQLYYIIFCSPGQWIFGFFNESLIPTFLGMFAAQREPTCEVIV